MRRLGIGLVLAICLAVTLPLLGRMAHLDTLLSSNPHRVFVILGFHTNFYHSWRGDTPDEAGFGTDIRIVRAILRTLDLANDVGMDARGYWESDVLFTLERILPEFAPDILDSIRRRVDAGLDEILVAPYNNGFFSAMTEDEVRASLRWAIHNPWGSGVSDLFSSFQPILRPQEAMFTPGLIPILLEEGFDGLILPYSTYPFTSFSNFVPPLPTESRFGLTWMRSQEDGPRILLFPSVSPGDVLDFVSLEKWMLTLRRLQTSGQVNQDLVIHINFDADAESWLPLDMPRGLRWLPNTGGLQEYIDAVNKYSWASFTTPGEFIADRQPQGEVIIRQDTADGAWDGYYAWAEKFDSQEVWTAIQQSRLFEQQARSIAATLPGHAGEALHETYFAGRDGSFFRRIEALSTTHFGMSTPMVNEERFAVAMATAEAARDRALAALHTASRGRTRIVEHPASGALYALELHDDPNAPADLPRRIPLLFPKPALVDVVDAQGEPIPFAVVDQQDVGRSIAAQMLLPMEAARRPQPISVHRVLGAPPASDDSSGFTPKDGLTLANERLTLQLSTANGIERLALDDIPFAENGFLDSFITYQTDGTPASSHVTWWTVEPAEAAPTDFVQRARLRGRIPLDTGATRLHADVVATFTLPSDAPFLIADVEVQYPYTEKSDILSTPQQKLRKLIDRRWIEAAPFELQPHIQPAAGEYLRVWRENYLGVVAAYDTNYGSINPNNANLDSFNHHVTAAWVAVAGGGRGLLLAQDATVRASPAFAPMRLRHDADGQRLRINPFGSYFGAQMDYSHMGGTGLARDLTVLIGPAFRPNGPSFNGRTLRFSLLLAPYAGDAPPEEAQAAARAFFSPPAVVILDNPPAIDALVPADIDAEIQRRRVAQALATDSPVPEPKAFLASPTAGAVDLVWDPPQDLRVERHEVEWRSAGAPEWDRAVVERASRLRVEPLTDGAAFEFRVRALGGDHASDWSAPQTIVVGPVGEEPLIGFTESVPPRFILRLAHQTLRHLLTVP